MPEISLEDAKFEFIHTCNVLDIENIEDYAY